MGQKDLAQNDYFNDKVRFADACNGILFQGKEMIKPEDLQEIETDIVYHEDGKRRKIIPDKVRKWNGLYIAILSVENQTKVDYRMVFRIMKAEDAETICDMAGINVKLIRKVNEEGEEVVDMCKAWDDWKEEGKSQGEAKLAELIQKLLKENRVDLVNIVTQSEKERELYYEKYSISGV